MKKYNLKGMTIGEVDFIHVVKLKSLARIKEMIMNFNRHNDEVISYKQMGGGIEIRRTV